MVERDLRLKTSRMPRSGNQSVDRVDLFLNQLWTRLCANYREPKDRTTLTAIGELIANNNSRSGVDSVVTFNFDDLLQAELRRRKVAVQSVTSSDRQRVADCT
jgi:hypothetical protein